MFLYGDHPHAGDFLSREHRDGKGWLDFMLRVVPLLREAGWTVEVADDFPLRLAPITGAITAELRQGSGIDWFDLELGAVVDGERIDLVPALIELIASEASALEQAASKADHDKLLLLPLPDGRLLSLPRWSRSCRSCSP